jgi:cysteine desulfurase
LVGNETLSYVLKSIGVKENLFQTHIRFGIGRFTTSEEIDYILNLVKNSVQSV